MRQFLKFLSLFDWISPTAAILEDIFAGSLFSLDAWTFFIPFDEAVNNGWSPFHITNLLARYGIKNWGSLFDGDEYSFKVKLEQAQWTEYVLLRHGVPIHEKSLGSPSSKRKKSRTSGQNHQKSNKDPLSFLDNFFDKYM